MKKLLALLLAALLVVPALAFTAVADTADVWSGEKTRVDGVNEGVWQGTVGRTEYYDVNYAIDANNLYVEIDYYGTLNGTSASYGNGLGTNIRMWFYDPDMTIGGAAATSYTSFIDISYVDGEIWNRFLNNTSANSNSAALEYAYGAASTPYTIENTLGENTWVMKLTMPLSEVSTNGKIFFWPIVSNADATLANDALHSGDKTIWGNGWAWDYSCSFPRVDIAYGQPTDSASLELVSSNKEVAISGCGIGFGDYTANLTDGAAHNAITYDNNWFAFYYNTTAAANVINAPGGIGYATIDLGTETSGIGKFCANIGVNTGAGIVAPDSITVSASNDGVVFGNIGTFDVSVTTVTNLELVLDNTISARYIRFTFDLGGTFAFVNELEVYACDTLAKVGFDRVNHYDWTTIAFGGDLGDTALSAGEVLLAASDDATATVVDKIGGSWFTWWYKVLAEWDAELGTFKVIAIDGPNSTAYTEWTLGEGRLAFMCNASYASSDVAGNKIDAYYLADVKLGDALYFYGDYEAMLTGSGAISDTYVTVNVMNGDDYYGAPEVNPLLSLGVKVNSELTGIRFGASYTKVEKYGEVTDLGMLVLPTAKLGDAALDLDLAASNALVAKVSANCIDAESYVDGQAFEDYASFTYTVTLLGLAGHEDAEITAVPYITYAGGKTFYGDAIAHSFNSAATAAGIQ